MVEEVKAGASMYTVAKKYGISHSMVIRYVRDADKMAAPKNDKRFQSRNRRRLPRPRIPHLPEMEDHLLNWFKNQRSNGLTVITNDIKDKALDIFKDLKEKQINEEQALRSIGTLRSPRKFYNLIVNIVKVFI